MLNENNYINEAIFTVNKKLILKKAICYENNLLLYPKYKDLFHENLQILIKNVKTKSFYLCPFTIKNDCLNLNLKFLLNDFTDYEGSVFIKNIEFNYCYIPIIKKDSLLLNSITSSHYCFARVTDNNELRISAVSQS